MNLFSLHNSKLEFCKTNHRRIYIGIWLYKELNWFIKLVFVEVFTGLS